ncbi:MAG: porin family protein [Nitrospinae bacterium]|nr:porin family protein [Nitrospinota bacterium]
MKRFTGFLLAGLLLLTAAPAWAQQAYLSGNIGFGIRPDADISTGEQFQNDPAFVINGAIGVELNPTIRIEGEIGLHTNTADISGFADEFTFGIVSFMGNGYFDIPTNSPLRPYVGVGLGFAVANLEQDFFGITADDSDLVAAFQLMAGLGYDISPKATLTFGYRYFTTSDPTFVLFGAPFETEITSHDFLFGARFRF